MSTLTEAKISEQLRLLVKIYLINQIKESSSLYVYNHMHLLPLLYGANAQWKIHISR